MPKTRTDWTELQVELLKEHYANTLNSELSALIGVTEPAVGAKAHKLGLRKTKEFLIFHSKKGMFKPGQVPPNKGKKMPEHVYEKCKGTMFKKGNVNHNTRFDGATRIQTEESGRQYRFIRISKREWIPMARYNYEKHIGPIPDGMIVAFIDGDSLNDGPENLELLSREENLRRNRNLEKFSETMKGKYERGEITNNPMLNLNDKIVASWIAPRNRALQNEVAKNQDLIELKRNQIKLKRQCQQQQSQS